MFIIGHNLFAVHRPLQAVQPFLSAETVIRLTLVQQHFGIFHIDPLFLAIALYVRSHRAADIRAFIMLKAGINQSIIDNLRCTFDKTFLICIFNTKNVISILVFGN